MCGAPFEGAIAIFDPVHTQPTVIRTEPTTSPCKRRPPTPPPWLPRAISGRINFTARL